MILPIIIEVADQKPIFLARDEVVGIKGKIIKSPVLQRGFQNHLSQLASTRISRITTRTYLPAGYKFFPEGLTGTVGVGFR